MMKETFVTHDLAAAKGSLLDKFRLLMNRSDFPINIFRIEQPVSQIDPLRWLRQQKADMKIYWSERDEQYEMAGIGCTDVISGDTIEGYDNIFKQMRSNLNPEFRNMRYYGGFQFDKNERNDSIWENFGAFRFFVPQVEVIRDKNCTKLAFNIRYRPELKHNHDLIQELIDKIECGPDFTMENQTKPQSRSQVPDKEGWFQNVAKAKVLFQQTDLEKIVLARMSKFEFSDKVDADRIVNQMKTASPKAIHFYFQPKEEVAFLGASPELLFRRERNTVFTEAVAGTHPRGKNEDEDKKLANDLLNSPKDIHEHALVCQFVEETMRTLCSDLILDDKINIIRADKVQHLYKRIQGILNGGFNDSDIISSLHPTPAVGGLPQTTALREIGNMEGFHRGWYAAPIGWVDADSAEFAVGIRSGLVNQNNLYLFAGAGIVPESDPEREWQELEQKISQFIKFFQD